MWANTPHPSTTVIVCIRQSFSKASQKYYQGSRTNQKHVQDPNTEAHYSDCANHRHGHKSTVGSITKSFVNALRQSLGGTDDLISFQRPDHVKARNSAILTCG